MSYLDNNNRNFNWVAAPALTSLRMTPGCAQCGSQMELDGQGKTDLSGKCPNCLSWVSDEDDFFEDLED